MKLGLLVAIAGLAVSPALAKDNELSEQERKQGWLLLFDGSSLNGWMTSSQKPSRTPV